VEEDAVKTEKDYKQKLRRYEYLLKERSASVEAENAAISSLEKTITALASGALGLSITFVRFIAPEPVFKEILYMSWGFLVSSLLVILFSFLISRKAQVKYRDILEKQYEDPNCETRNIWGIITNGCNWLSLITLIIGVISFAIFAGINI